MDVKLKRSSKDKRIAGICGGMAEYLNADPTVVRTICALLILLSGFSGIFVCLLVWIILPRE